MNHGQSVFAQLLSFVPFGHFEEGPERVAHRFASPVGAAPLPGISGFHLFSFGGVEASALWQQALAEGRFCIDEGGISLTR